MDCPNCNGKGGFLQWKGGPQVSIVERGDILLTSGIGGPAAKWKDKLISRAIMFHQRAQMSGEFNPTRTHAELICDSQGGTFSARWRTRYRSNGLWDYIGSEITIARPVAMTDPLFRLGCQFCLDRFDGDIYPVHRILLQAMGTWTFRWLPKIGIGTMALCSEVVAAAYHAMAYGPFMHGWKGWTPAMIERTVRTSTIFNIVFDGKMDEEAFKRLTILPQERY